MRRAGGSWLARWCGSRGSLAVGCINGDLGQDRAEAALAEPAETGSKLSTTSARQPGAPRYGGDRGNSSAVQPTTALLGTRVPRPASRVRRTAGSDGNGTGGKAIDSDASTADSAAGAGTSEPDLVRADSQETHPQRK